VAEYHFKATVTAMHDLKQNPQVLRPVITPGFEAYLYFYLEILLRLSKEK